VSRIAKPAICSVSRCAQVFLTRSFDRPSGYLLSRTFDTTFKAGLAGVFEHLLPIDLKALAELDRGASDQLLEEHLPFD
jgi:hypothetical protein